MSTAPISLDMALDIARHPGSYGRSMTALALDVLAGQVEQLRAELDEARRERSGMQHLAQKNRTALDEARAELARRDSTIAAAGQVLAAWDTDCPGGIHDSVYAAMDRLRAALSAPVEAGATEPAPDDEPYDSCARCSCVGDGPLDENGLCQVCADPAPTEAAVEAGARALFGLTRAAELSSNADRLWARFCADGDRPYFQQAEAVLRAAALAGGPSQPTEEPTP